MLQLPLTDPGRLEQRTRVPLPEHAGLEYEFGHEEHHLWRIVALGNARDLGFTRAPIDAIAYVCAPLARQERATAQRSQVR
jgi:hypothetical protein